MELDSCLTQPTATQTQTASAGAAIHEQTPPYFPLSHQQGTYPANRCEEDAASAEVSHKQREYGSAGSQDTPLPCTRVDARECPAQGYSWWSFWVEGTFVECSTNILFVSNTLFVCFLFFLSSLKTQRTDTRFVEHSTNGFRKFQLFKKRSKTKECFFLIENMAPIVLKSDKKQKDEFLYGLADPRFSIEPLSFPPPTP